MRSHLVLSHPQDIWKKATGIHNIDIHLNSESSLWFNFQLCIDGAVHVESADKQRDLDTWRSVEGNVLKSFKEKIQKFGLPRSRLWQYFQLDVYCAGISKGILGLGHEASQYYDKIFLSDYNTSNNIKDYPGNSFKSSQVRIQYQNQRKLSRNINDSFNIKSSITSIGHHKDYIK